MRLIIQPNGASNEYFVGVAVVGGRAVAYLFPKSKFAFHPGEVDVDENDLEKAAVAMDFSYELAHSIPTPAEMILALYRRGVVDLTSALTGDRARQALTRRYAEAIDMFLAQLRQEKHNE